MTWNHCRPLTGQRESSLESSLARDWWFSCTNPAFSNSQATNCDLNFFYSLIPDFRKYTMWSIDDPQTYQTRGLKAALTASLGHLTRTAALLTFLVTPVLLVLQVNMSAVKKASTLTCFAIHKHQQLTEPSIWYTQSHLGQPMGHTAAFTVDSLVSPHMPDTRNIHA